MRISYSGIQSAVVGALSVLPFKPRLRVLSCGCGLFGDIILSMNAIQFAERHHLSGSIYWGRRSLYFDPGKGGNAHEYFFENGRFDFSEKRQGRGYTLDYVPPSDNFQTPKGTRPRDAMKRLLDNYAAPRRELLAEVDAFMRDRLDAPHVLGIHVRMTDAAKGFEGRKTQPPENFVAAAEEWLANKRGGIVFLATDAAEVAEKFSAHFGDRLVLQDAIRSEDGTSLHGHKDQGLSGNPYRKGREALLDALILSRCDFLIRSFSFLTAYSLCLNPTLEFLDLDKENLRVMRTRWLHE